MRTKARLVRSSYTSGPFVKWLPIFVTGYFIRPLRPTRRSCYLLGKFLGSHGGTTTSWRASL
eukprot:2153833-Pyramimonas_sp.AAC.1